MLSMATDGDTVFIYLSGEQVVPADVTHVVVDGSVNIIPRLAFFGRTNLVSVKFHYGVDVIEEGAFDGCTSLTGLGVGRGCVDLRGVRAIQRRAFRNCTSLFSVRCQKVEIIREEAFFGCHSLTMILLKSVRTIERLAFYECKLIRVSIPQVERIEGYAFCCNSLQFITIPLRDNMFPLCGSNQFDYCTDLRSVEIVGEKKFVSSLLKESWRNAMNCEIERIGCDLWKCHVHKTWAIQRWSESFISKVKQYRDENNRVLNELTTLLELAAWKAKLDDKEGCLLEKEGVRTTRGRRKRARKEICVTSGASIVIKNVLPFLVSSGWDGIVKGMNQSSRSAQSSSSI